jgi:hypothetical protein
MVVPAAACVRSKMSAIPTLSRPMMAVVCALSLIGAGYVDYLTGYDLVFSAIYLIPASLCAWYIGRRAVILMALASAILSWFADSGHPYTNPSIQYWNAFSCLLVSLIGGLLVFRLKRINSDLKDAVSELKRSTEEIAKLRDGLQVVCAWTQKIKVGDTWMSPDEFLSTQLHLKISHGISPEGHRKFEEESSSYKQSA